MFNKTTRVVALSATACLLLTGCETKNPSTQEAPGAVANTVAVNASDTACEVSTQSVESGNTTFEIKNNGAKTTEFYLLGDDKLRVVSEKENIPAGASASLSITLQPGQYYTACKPGMRGSNLGVNEFTVTGAEIKLDASEKELYEQVTQDYVNFVKNEVSELVPKTEELAAAYAAGDDAKARELYAETRVHYERIEPIAEALGVLDPRIDYREIDYLAEAEQLQKDDPTYTEWLGFHRIEKDLWVPAKDRLNADGTNAWENWQPSSPEQRQKIADTLVNDVNKLQELVTEPEFITKQQLTVASVSNGAAALLEEISVGKVTGEEDWWSHTDLYDFQANLEGARIAFDLVAPIAKQKSKKGEKLVQQINTEFDKLQTLLDKYGNLQDGYVSYDQVTSKQQKELVAQINATRKPLAKLTSAVLGLKE